MALNINDIKSDFTKLNIVYILSVFFICFLFYNIFYQIQILNFIDLIVMIFNKRLNIKKEVLYNTSFFIFKIKL